MASRWCPHPASRLSTSRKPECLECQRLSMIRLRWERKLGLPRVPKYAYLLNLRIFTRACKAAGLWKAQTVKMAGGRGDIAGGLHIRPTRRPQFRHRLAELLQVDHDELWIRIDPADSRGKKSR